MRKLATFKAQGTQGRLLQGKTLQSRDGLLGFPFVQKLASLINLPIQFLGVGFRSSGWLRFIDRLSAGKQKED
jgi:hypothetical protein